MVAAKQNPGDFPTFVVGGTRVVRVVENPVGKGILFRRVAVAQHPGDQAHHGIGDDQRGQNAARQHKVAYGNLIVDQVVGHALIDAFIVATKQDQVLLQREFARCGIGKPPSLRRHQNDFRFRRSNRREREVDGFDFHHHPRATAIGSVIDRAMAVSRPIAQIHRIELRQVFLLCPLEDALIKHATAHFGEDCEDLDFQADVL